MHTQLDLKTSIPEFILFTNAAVHDVNVLNVINFEANSFYIMDRGYVDYKRLYKIHLCDAFFVTRAKDNMNYRRLYSHPKDKTQGVLYDQTILLNNYYASKDYPKKIRIIKFRDEKTGRDLIFLTNNFHLKATEIAQLYKHRWKIGLFFKWIKQHLKIKSFREFEFIYTPKHGSWLNMAEIELHVLNGQCLNRHISTLEFYIL